MTDIYLTTVDNPYDPSINFDAWYAYDTLNGYNSCGLLDRFSYTSESMTKHEYNVEIERAIDEIVKNDPFNIYKKLVVPHKETKQFVEDDEL